MFECCIRVCSYTNDSRYDLVRHQARCRHRSSTDKSELKERSVVAEEVEVEDSLEELDPSYIDHQLQNPGSGSTNSLEIDDRIREIPGFVVSAAWCMRSRWMAAQY